MTDTTPTPKRTTAAKTTGAAKTPAAKAPAAKTPAAKAPAAKGPAAKAPAAKAPAAKAPAAKAPATRTAAAKAPAAKAPVAKSPAAKTPAATSSAAKTAPAKTTAAKRPAAKATPAAAALAPVEPIPSTVAAPAAATAPAGWYPVAGTTQQRWWDGSQWTDHVAPINAAVAPPAATTLAATPTAVAHHHEPLRAAAGVKPGTVWFWLMAVGVPVLTILQLIPTSIYLNQVIGGNTSDPSAAAADLANPGYIIVALSGWFIDAVCIVFALLDWRELKARGVPRPFHWAWSFFVLLIGWPAVYVIGRTVVAKHRTGSGLAPLWVFIGLEVVAFIVGLVVAVSAAIQFFTLFGNLLSTAGNVL